VGASGQEAFRALIRDHVAPALRGLGFVGSGQAFRLPIPDAIALLGFQRSRHDQPDDVSFTVNLTAGPTATWEAARQLYPFLPEQPAANTRYPGGLWHARLGLQMPQARDVWWEVASTTRLATVGEEVVTAIRDHGIPALLDHARGPGEPRR